MGDCFLSAILENLCLPRTLNSGDCKVFLQIHHRRIDLAGDLALLVQAINKITLIYGLVLPRFVEVVLDQMS